jgi:hypothetical protein
VTTAKNAFHNIFHLSKLGYHTERVDIAWVLLKWTLPDTGILTKGMDTILLKRV